MRLLMAFIISMVLTLGPVPSVEAHAPVVNSYSVSNTHVVEKPKPHKPKNKRHKNGHRNKKGGSAQALTFASLFGDIFGVDDNGNGKSNGKAKGQAKKNPKGKKAGKKKSSRAGNRSGSTSGNPTVVQPPLTVKCGDKYYSARQGRVICVTIEQPVVTQVEYRTRTVTEKVLYSLGVITAAGFFVGLIALFLGFVLGWKRAGKAEEKFLDSVLHDTKED